MVCSYFGPVSDHFTEVVRFLNLDPVLLELAIKDLPEGPYLSRLTLSEQSMPLKRIKRSLSHQRQSYHLLAIEPKTPATAAFAARDNRVDIVRINPRLGLTTFNARYAKRLVENDKIIEFDLSFFFNKYFAHDLRPVMRILETFHPDHIPVLLTNLPHKVEHLRSYKGLQSLGRLLGITNKQSHPKHILQRVDRNIKKIKGDIPFPGVEVHGRQE